MKRLFLMLFSIGLFFVNAEARCYPQPEFPGSGPAPKAYCWNIVLVHSAVSLANGNGPEDTSDKSSTVLDHGGDLITIVEVYGYGDRTTVALNYDGMDLIQTNPIINSFNIIIGKRYFYERVDTTGFKSGEITAKEYNSTKTRLYVR